MCGFCFKTQLGNFTSGWISSENVFVAATRKGETLPKLANLLKNAFFVVALRKENLSSQEFALRAEQRLETALRCFRELEKNWTRQLTMNNYCDWKNEYIPSFQSTSSWFGSVNHYPWELKHPAKSHSWTHRKSLKIIQIQEETT